MKIKVDYDVCEANAVCMGLAPEVFEVDDEDNLHVLMPEPPAELLDRVRHAVRSCPKAALSLENE
ncbi:ferredoxin [Microbispora bryophytorum]|uniref:Putative ferredoxin FdxD n=1 Tax=Microbispora bryophytorum TaxID=1460882 RepID=A0A8H9LCW4_9ACTN|nr:ferredoxin [Microbispora bryophytorum]MBD3138127.1 ferredoxin [Microbispora bryophytorum]TQS05329.1 ferredoxin [Microbispora bryophytorum]GGO21638.1 putative ferredoxin FdxD [Microbispora bryophytorum]